jgi:hypothetical protein
MEFPKVLYKLVEGVLHHTTVGGPDQEETAGKAGFVSSPTEAGAETAPATGTPPPLKPVLFQHVAESLIGTEPAAEE